MSRNPQPFTPAFAVIRVDGPFSESMTNREITELIVVKKVVATEREAEREVARLNEMEAHSRRGPGRFYFAEYTRLFIQPNQEATTIPE